MRWAQSGHGAPPDLSVRRVSIPAPAGMFSEPAACSQICVRLAPLDLRWATGLDSHSRSLKIRTDSLRHEEKPLAFPTGSFIISPPPTSAAEPSTSPPSPPAWMSPRRRPTTTPTASACGSIGSTATACLSSTPPRLPSPTWASTPARFTPTASSPRTITAT